jgi:hypothetical protein
VPLADDLEKLKGDPNLVVGMIARIAPRVRDHEHLMNKLSTVPAEWKQIVYDILKPNLRFEAWPLHRYMSAAADRAVREMLPTMNTEGKFEHFHKPEIIVDAEAALARSLAKRTLTLACSKCAEEGKFYGVGEETPIAVMMKARRAGWVYDNTGDTPREICPKCPTSLRKESVN